MAVRGIAYQCRMCDEILTLPVAKDATREQVQYDWRALVDAHIDFHVDSCLWDMGVTVSAEEPRRRC